MKKSITTEDGQRVQYLFKKHCPNLCAMLLEANNIKWHVQGGNFTDQLESGGIYKTSLIGLVFFAETGDSFAASFLRYCDTLIRDCIKFLRELGGQEKLQNMAGTFTDFRGLNYLNAIGELSILKQLINAGYTLVSIEDTLEFPEFTRNGNVQGIDFVFKDAKGKKHAVEVVNIHNTDNCESFQCVMDDIRQKLKEKIAKKTGGKTPQKKDVTFSIAPVLWTTKLSEHLEHSVFFDEFATTFGGNLQLETSIPILGLTGFCKLPNSNNILFGEIGSLYRTFDFSPI